MAYTRQQPLEPKPVIVSEWLANVRTMLGQTISKPIVLQEFDRSQGACVCIDAAQLTTAVINLLANARDAIKPGSGSIELSIDCVELDSDQASLWNNLAPGRYVQFQVADTGKA